LRCRSSARAPKSARDDLVVETSAFMRRTAYRNGHRLNPESATDGAYGPVNRKAARQGENCCRRHRLPRLLYWSRISGNARFEKLAEKVAAYSHQRHAKPASG
jgi:hypothetical protein